MKKDISVLSAEIGHSAAQYKNLIVNLVESVDEINVLIKIYTFVKAWSQ